MTPVLNNGIFVRDVELSMGSDITQYHLLDLANKFGNNKPDDFGPVDLFIMAQKIESPLYQFASFGKESRKVDDIRGEFKWQQPITEELPFIFEDIESSNTTKGKDGQPFRLKFNKRAFGHTAVITYDKMNGVRVLITQDDILPTGDGFIYTCRLVNGDSSRYLENQFLKTGTKWFQVSSMGGEMDQRYDSVQTQGGFREYMNYVGNSNATFEFIVGSKADDLMKAGINVNSGKVGLMDIWRVHDKKLLEDPAMVSIEALSRKLGQKGLYKAMEEQKITRAIVDKIAASGIAKIGRDVEHELMWGLGGIITTEGPEILRESVGLWKQLDSSFKTFYNKNTFSLDMFKTEINNFYFGRVELVGPDPKKMIIVQTGRGGMEMVTAAIQAKALGTGLITESTEIGAISGSNPMELHFGFSFTSYTIPYLANIKFVYNPALDPVHANDIENPIIDGYRLSSYTFIVFDITDQGSDNITLVEKSWDQELKWRYMNGKRDYMGATSGFQSSGGNYGYKVQMEQAKKAIWVKDPTKVLKFVMRNPITGGSF